MDTNVCEIRDMSRGKDRNLTVRLPVSLLRELNKQSAAEGVSMNAYLGHLLARALDGPQNDLQQMAAARLLGRAKAGIYHMKRALTREEAHDRGA